MPNVDFDAILEKLDIAKRHKRDVKIAVAKAEMKAIEDEYLAYYDGAYDSIKAVRAALEKEGADGNA